MSVNQPNLNKHIGQVQFFCLTEPEKLGKRFSQVRFGSFLRGKIQLNLTEPDRTYKKSQKTEETEPLTPLFRGGQVRFGSVANWVQL